MVGDKIELKPHHYATAREIIGVLQGILNKHKRFCIAIGGESGSGKSVTAICLAQLLNENRQPALILHQDDYFKLPPETNRLERAKDLSYVGPTEVDLDLLEQHIAAFREGATQVIKPLVIFHENRIVSETASFENVEILILEGTYTNLLPVDCRIFMARTYLQTYEQRLARGRDVFDDNLNKILAIEHEIIKQHALSADVYIDSNYKVSRRKE